MSKIEMYFDGTGHYYRNESSKPWIRMDGDEEEQASMLEVLQNDWEKVTGVRYELETIIAMLQQAEQISISYEIADANHQKEAE